MEKSLDRKLAALRADPQADVFIIADAKDADMAFGLAAPGPVSPEMVLGAEARFRSLAEFRELIRQVVRQGVVDIMLMSASTNEVLTIEERLFDSSAVTPSARTNDTTDIWAVQGGRYLAAPSSPFRSATLDHIQCGKLECEGTERRRGADLGLYSITFNNDTDRDQRTLEAFKSFRLEAEAKGFRYFLEVFDPNLPEAVDVERMPRFVNDCIARSLAGVTRAGRPLFLKMVYHGPRAMEELCHYDRDLIVGILGGSAGTTLDAFKLIHEAQKHGARVALFGRKINQAEHQLAFVEFLRLIVEHVLGPEDAVRAYHATLGELGIQPRRRLEQDLVLETSVMRYATAGTTAYSLPAAPAPGGGRPVANRPATPAPRPVAAAPPDFARMTPQERLEYHRRRLGL